MDLVWKLCGCVGGVHLFDHFPHWEQNKRVRAGQVQLLDKDLAWSCQVCSYLDCLHFGHPFVGFAYGFPQSTHIGQVSRDALGFIDDGFQSALQMARSE